MSNVAPGWWQASDGRWYPPETHPNYVRRPIPMPPAPWQRQSEAPPGPQTFDPVEDEAQGGRGDTDQSDDPTYVDADGIDWWWDGRNWNYWVESEDDWRVFLGGAPSGLFEVDTDARGRVGRCGGGNQSE